MDDDLINDRHHLRIQLEELAWWLKIAEKASASDAYDAGQIVKSIANAADDVGRAVKAASSNDHEELMANELRNIRRILNELKILGIGVEDLPYAGLSSREIVREIPGAVIDRVNGAAEIIRKDEEAAETRRRVYEEVALAIKHDVFLEYVQRHPGKGCNRILPGFDEDCQYDRVEGYRVAWTECEVFIYRNDLWVIGRTFNHSEFGPSDRTTDYSLIAPAEAAARILDSGISLPIEDIIWLKKLAATNPAPAAPPGPEITWNRELGELTAGGKIARKVARLNQAKNIVKLLDAFQELNWPIRMDSPFPGNEVGRTKLRETIREFNSASTGIKFEADGTGEGVRYRLEEIADSLSESQPPGDFDSF